MAKVRCGNLTVELAAGEKVLDALLRVGHKVSNGCRAGACQACLVRSTAGAPPAAAQVGLKDTLIAENYFLSCLALPTDDLEVELAGTKLDVPARIVAVGRLSADVLAVSIMPDGAFRYRPGQFVNLVRDDGLVRSYSIANLPADDQPIELHVRLLPGGRMSGWLAQPEIVGQRVALRGPAGSCFYVAGDQTRPLLLAGTGTGLAPLLGILREALACGHQGPITLFHGGRTPEGLYLTDALAELAARTPQLTYRACVLEGTPPDGGSRGRLDDIVCEAFPAPADVRAYICGDPAFVAGLRRRLFMSGARMRDILADSFLIAPPPSPSEAPAPP